MIKDLVSNSSLDNSTREILDKLPLGIFILELLSTEKKEFRNLFINKANSEIVGVNLKPFEGMTLRESFPDAYEHGFPDKYLEALESQQPINMGEVVYGDKVVEQQTFALEVVPLTNQLVMLTTENISKLKLAQKNLANKVRELETKSSEMEQFVYIASHDLRHPLLTIINYAKLFEMEFASVLNEMGKKYLEFMSNSAKRMDSNIRDLLDYSRLSKALNLEEVNCGLAIQEVLNDLHVTIESKNAKIEVGEMPVLMAYGSNLKLLIQNLITNAIKFQEPGRVPEIRISAIEKENCWQFAFQDNGIGIDPKKFKKVFELFQKLHRAEQYEGTGIGLAHCKKIVELHGGKIWIESEPGKGSTFYFTIKTNLQ